MADARITGPDTIEVWSEKIAKPVAVRYAWADAPHWANLLTKDGLPVWAFRTDTWPRPAKSQQEKAK